MYSQKEVMDFIKEENVGSIRLTFCDIFGNAKNISIMSSEIERAFCDGISFDASAIRGFTGEERSDLFLHPDPKTLSILPWGPEHSRVIRMFCDIKNPDGSPYPHDSRHILKEAVKTAQDAGIHCNFGPEYEFYLFRTNENGESNHEPFDHAGYMDIAPEDRCENIRREICFALSDMNIHPESSHHEEGPGQNEIDFRYSDALQSADNAITFKTVVKTMAMRNGLIADFSPKPLPGQSGNGMHINMSVSTESGDDRTMAFMAGILHRIAEMTLFLNPSEDSYLRLGEKKAPLYISWSPENRSQLIRIPAVKSKLKRLELRSPDPTGNPYLGYALLIHAGLEGILQNLNPSEPINLNLYHADKDFLKQLPHLPKSLTEAVDLAANSTFIRRILPAAMIDAYCGQIQ